MNSCVKFIRAVASEKFWLAQAATRCPWGDSSKKTDRRSGGVLGTGGGL